jgi:hypothetical protein
VSAPRPGLLHDQHLSAEKPGRMSIRMQSGFLLQCTIAPLLEPLGARTLSYRRLRIATGTGG